MSPERRPLQKEIDENRRIVGVSNTYTRETGKKPKDWLSHAREGLTDAFQDVQTVTVLPYALKDMDSYLGKLRRAFLSMGFRGVVSPHQHLGDEREVLKDAEAVYIGGGSTLRLLANLHGLRHDNGEMVDRRANASRSPLIATIRRRVAGGMPIAGASAGLNVMTHQVMTTNDMHIAPQEIARGIIVSRLDALGLLPEHLSINPHYQDVVKLEDPKVREYLRRHAPEILTHLDHQGESRATRLTEGIEMNPEKVILAIREGAYLVVNGMDMRLKGTTGGRVFSMKSRVSSVEAKTNLSNLLLPRSSSLS